MKIRTSNKPVDEQALENSFVAVDDLETPMGTLSVAPLRNDELMPERPFEVKLTVHGKAAAADALLALMQRYQAAGYDDIVPISAAKGDGVEELKQLLARQAELNCLLMEKTNKEENVTNEHCNSNRKIVM